MAILFCLPEKNVAYETTLANLNTASNLDESLIVFNIGHRFYGQFDNEVLDTFFGSSAGAEVGMFMRYKVNTSIELNTGYIGRRKSYLFGISNSVYQSDSVNSEIRVELESAKPSLFNKRTNKIYANLENSFRFNKINIHSNIHSINETICVTFGNSFEITDEIYLFSELYPEINNLGNKYVFGVELSTFGHQFQVMLQNSVGQLERHIMLSKAQPYLILGFNIKRVFEL